MSGHNPPQRLSGINPYVRPKRRHAVLAGLPALVYRRSDPTPPVLYLTGAAYAWNNFLGWRIEYRCIYFVGGQDRRLHERQIIAATRERALEKLQQYFRGTAREILVYRVRPPPSRAEIAEVKKLNEERAWLDTDGCR